MGIGDGFKNIIEINMEHKEKWIFESKYLSFWFAWRFEISFSICGYFDNRPRINLGLLFFHMIIKLPFRNSWTDECDPPTWGIRCDSDMLFIYRGGKGNLNGGNKWWTMYAPWMWTWVRTSALKKDGTWEHETPKNNKNFYREEWNDVLWSETHPYTYVLRSGEVQKRLATIKIEEREWKWYWFKWLNKPRRVQRTISIDFDGEVGERSGSWKGGTTGCGYELLVNETPLECLRRMEKERSFN